MKTLIPIPIIVFFFSLFFKEKIPYFDGSRKIHMYILDDNMCVIDSIVLDNKILNDKK